MKYFNHFLAAGTIATLVLGAAPALAQSMTATAGVNVSGSLTTRQEREASTSAERASLTADAEANAKANADQEISGRITSLNTLTSQVQAMAHLTAVEKSTIASTVSSDISSLTTLQSTIDADTSTTTLKADVQSITKNERIYLLVEPQIRILAAADRENSIGGIFTALASKIQARLTASPNASAAALLADMQVKVNDANTQSTDAISGTAPLLPDNGVTSVATANAAAISTARAAIKVGQQDLEAAQQDAVQIVKDIKDSGSGSVNLTASTSSS